jgi:FkbM family methyltransferase
MIYTVHETKYGPMAYLQNDYAFVQALNEGRIYEQELVEDVLAPFIKQSHTILDVGAHAGSHSLIYSALNPDAQIYAYEPQRALHDLLKFNIAVQKRYNIIPISVALGNKWCIAQMHATIPDGPNCNMPLNETDMFNFGGRQLGVGGEAVEIYTLDGLWNSGTPPVDFIKIDVEGFENFVVDGALNLIRRCSPVIFFEHNEKRPTVYMEGYYNPARSILAALKELEYTIKECPGGNFLAIPNTGRWEKFL